MTAIEVRLQGVPIMHNALWSYLFGLSRKVNQSSLQEQLTPDSLVGPSLTM